MKLMKLGVGIAALLLLAVLATGSYSQIQPTKAFASELSIDKSMVPVKDYCDFSCNTSALGQKYCGFGGLQIGCHHVTNNTCIFWICPNDPPE